MLPRAKKESFTGERFVLTESFAISIEKEYSENAKTIFELFLDGCSVEIENDAVVKVKRTDSFSHNEEYSIEIKETGIEILFGEYVALRNAISAFSQLARMEEDGFSFPIGYVNDWPDADFRGVMLDLARGIRKLDELKREIVLIAKSRLNYLHLHISDEKGVCYRMDCLPEEMYLPDAYTREEMKEVSQLAQLLGLEIIPEYDMPGHSLKMAESFPEFSCDVPTIENPSKWDICPGTQEIYDMYEKIIADMTDLFTGKYFHMGGDELEFGTPNMREKNLLCLWDDCVKCKALREREGLKDRQEQYYYFANRINKIAKKYNRQMIMWSDQLDCTRPKGLDDDIIMHFWRIAGPGNGPSEGCSMKGQLEFGYKMINSQFEETYIDEPVYMQSDRLEKWEYNKIIDTEEYADSIIGSEACAWEYGNPAYKTKYDRGLASAVYLIADRLWDASPVEYDREYAKKLTDAVLGASTPLELNVFDALGDLIPNEEKLEKRIDRVKATESELKRITEFLYDNSKYKGGNLDRAKAYAELVEEVIEERRKHKKQSVS